MAKLRRSHQSRKHTVFAGGFRLVFILLCLVILVFVLRPIVSKMYDLSDDPEPPFDQEVFYLPAPDHRDILVKKPYFILAYSEQHEQPKWVAYELTVQHLNLPKVARSDFFEVDTNVKTGSATYDDYRGSGYSRGHLVPAADRAFDRKAMEATFLMSNISPQIAAFNGGIWRELEENVRDWARRRREVIVIAGPIIDVRHRTIGKNRVAVPSSFFKIILDRQREPAGIAFVIPNERSEAHLLSYAMSIDDAESLAGLDFFHELFTPSVEAEVESHLDHDKWSIDDHRYNLRITHWNDRD